MGIPRRKIEETEEEQQQYVKIDEALHAPVPGSCRRMVLIDGPNVIHTAGESGQKILDIKGTTDKLNASSILALVYKLLQHEFEVIVLMKKFFDEDKNADNFFILAELSRLEVLRFVEDKRDDDKVLLCSAEFYGAAVLTRDKFRQIFYDRYSEGKSRSVSYKITQQKLTSENKREFEKPGAMAGLFCNLALKDFDRLYAKPDDPDFGKVRKFYEQYKRSGALESTFSAVNILVDYLQCEFCRYTSTINVPVLPYFTDRIVPPKFEEFKRKYTNYISRNKDQEEEMRQFHERMLIP